MKDNAGSSLNGPDPEIGLNRTNTGAPLDGIE